MKKKNIEHVIQGIIFVLVIIGFIYVGKKDFSSHIEVDNEKFDHDYQNVSKDNVFVYASAQDILSKLNGGSAIIFMGFPENKWSGYYASILNDAAKETGIKEILYYNFYEDRKNKNATYQSIVLKLSKYLYTNDVGKQELFAPSLVIVKNGEILVYDAETSINLGNTKPEDYWSEYNKGLKKNNFITMFKDYLA